MSFMKKTLGFMAISAIIPASYALTARPSVIGTAASRMPTMTAYISSTGTTVSGTTTTSSALLANKDCIDAYTECIKGDDACGDDFSECTTKVLFHAKMPNCLSTLMQCNATGISSLFGTSSTTALSNIASKNTYGEVTDYTYPTDGSVLGQMIVAAAIANKYDTSTCVKRYTSCLKKDSVCGSDFELCTTDKEFRKQRVFCDSTLAKCQSEGLIELFGSTNTTSAPTKSSRVGELIEEGAALAAVNAVQTCYKVVDQCILNACTQNPYKCYEGSSQYLVDIVESINKGEDVDSSTLGEMVSAFTKKEISGYIRNSCASTIGSNKYCYATYHDGKMPTASQLKDEDNQEEIFDNAYSERMNSAMGAKIKDLITAFDTKAKSKCTDTIKSCVMRVCGSGSGAACYSLVFGSGDKSINKSSIHPDLKTGCAAIVNTDTNCKYAAMNTGSAGTYSYNYINNDAFDTLFPEYTDGKNDPIGAVALLNSTLATSYSDAAIAQMRKRCQSVATNCVRTMCGNDYQNCYRNRTDVYSTLTNTGSDKFDRSMNKVGGVLDYTVVLGLCLDTVKNSSVCEEHLSIEQAKQKTLMGKDYNSWGDATTVRGGWLDGGSASVATENKVQDEDENGNKLCYAAGYDPSYYGVCDTSTCGEGGNLACTEPVYISYTSFAENKAASSLFKELIYDIEKEAQAKYNAKLTKEQNMCLANNNGGIMGARDNGSTFQWVKLKSGKVPKSYAVDGLKDTQFAISNELYGSFCRIRVTLQSDDKDVQDAIRNGAKWSTAYFAVGDTFTCGSWIPSSELEKIAETVGDRARDRASMGDDRTRNWLTVLGVVGGGTGGGVLGNKIASGDMLGGLTGKDTTNNSKEAAEACVSNGEKYISAMISSNQTVRNNANTYLTRMLTNARKIRTDKKSNNDAAKKDDLERAIENLTNAMTSGGEYSTTVTCTTTTTTTTTTNNDDKCNFNDNASRDGYISYIAAGDNQLTPGVCTETCGPAGVHHCVLCPSSVPSSVVIAQSAVLKAATGDVPLQYAAATNKDDYRGEVNKLKDQCELWTDQGASSSSKALGTGIGTVVGGTLGGVLTYQAVKSVQNAKLDAKERAAYDEFMDQVGRHIKCYIGSDEAGEYGDTITTSLDDF